MFSDSCILFCEIEGGERGVENSIFCDGFLPSETSVIYYYYYF